MATKSETLLKRMTEAHGVPGFEGEVRDVFVKELKGVGEFSTDRTGSVVCDLGGRGPRIMLEAHMDEVGFRVQSVSSKGFLKPIPVGGWWPHVLLAKQLLIKTADGNTLIGVVGSISVITRRTALIAVPVSPPCPRAITWKRNRDRKGR